MTSNILPCQVKHLGSACRFTASKSISCLVGVQQVSLYSFNRLCRIGRIFSSVLYSLSNSVRLLLLFNQIVKQCYLLCRLIFNQKTPCSTLKRKTLYNKIYQDERVRILSLTQ